MKRKVIWFSRHDLTESQLESIKGAYDDVEIINMKELASKTITDWSEALEVLAALQDMAGKNAVMEVYGVFPPPIQFELSNHCMVSHERNQVPCYTAWNVNRAPEGERPTFEFKEWVRVGFLYE